MSGDNCKRTLTQLLRVQRVFGAELGMIIPFTAKLSVPTTVTPKFCKARPVPYAMCEAVEEQLDQLKAKGILEK